MDNDSFTAAFADEVSRNVADNSVVVPEVGPEMGASSSATQNEEEGTIFSFRNVTNVWKVHQDSGLDYWVYGLVLETDYKCYTSTRNTVDLVTIHTGRRYKEFDWLRKALKLEFPSAIIPGLPGLGLEGMLEKVDNVLGASEVSNEVPALVTYRMRGITLFVQWLSRCPQLRTCSLMKKFIEYSPDELYQFQAEWLHLGKQPLATRGRVGGWMHTIKKSVTTSHVWDPEIQTFKKMVVDLEAALTKLKDSVEKLWDGIVNLCEGYVVERLDSTVLKADEVTQALVKTAVVCKRAVYSFSLENEELFLALVVDLAFYIGLCHSCRRVLSQMDALAEIVRKPSAPPDAHDNLETHTVEFKRGFGELHKLKRPLIQNLVKNFAKLSSNMDPKGFPWEKHCQPLVDMIPDGW